jgi:hypothetical protein
MNSPISRTLVSFLFTSLAVLGNCPAEAGLVAGDVAILAIHADDTGGAQQGFAWVPLVDLPGGQQVHFTDNAWVSGHLLSDEGVATFTAPSSGVLAGTVLMYLQGSTPAIGSYTLTGKFDLSTDGDQVFAFIGSTMSPTFLFAAQTNSNEFQQSWRQSVESELPTGLEVGLNAVAAGRSAGSTDEWDNARYKGVLTSGTKLELLAAIANNANWEGSNSPMSPLSVAPAYTVHSVSAVPESNGLFVGAVVSLVALAWGCIVARRHRQPA